MTDDRHIAPATASPSAPSAASAAAPADASAEAPRPRPIAEWSAEEIIEHAKQNYRGRETRKWWRLWRRKIEWPKAPSAADYPDMKSYVASIRPLGWLPGTMDEHMTPEQVAAMDKVAGRKIRYRNGYYWDFYYNTPDHLWMGPWRIEADGTRVKA